MTDNSEFLSDRTEIWNKNEEKADQLLPFLGMYRYVTASEEWHLNTYKETKRQKFVSPSCTFTSCIHQALKKYKIGDEPWKIVSWIR